MATVEQLESWAHEAAEALQSKVGAEGGAVIVMILDGKMGRCQSSWRGLPPMTLWLLESSGRLIRDQIFPPAAVRQNPKT